MNSHSSTIASNSDSAFNGTAAFRNGVQEIPNTPTAHASNAALLSASRDIGYASVANAAGHDKSWVTRFFSDEARISRPELLAWLDVCGLRITAPSAESIADQELLKALLCKASAVLAREAGEAGDGDVRISAAEYKSLLHFAQVGIKAQQDRI